ncbi:JAB1/Mov34/MPN/PAD-1 ubiquitin protease-domain-containing protein, partial [Spinellus fusiger]
EEVIGLLIGHWETVASSNPYKADHTTAIVQEVFQVARSDKRKDRVEISPEQLHLAVVYTEELEKIRGQEMSVIGWYHSHPHITVCPSHVGKYVLVKCSNIILAYRSKDSATTAINGQPILWYDCIVL